MRRALCVLPFLCAVIAAVVAIPEAAAYEQYTHRWIARKAVEHLIAIDPVRYAQLAEYVDQIADGAHHEDDYFTDGDGDPSTLRVMRHFYRPTDRSGFTDDTLGTYPNSFEWGGLDNQLNEWDWTDSLAAYQSGDLEEAYFALGHVVHLISDLTVPAHTHLDNHGPPKGDDYESFCGSQMRSEFDGSLIAPPRGTALPTFTTVEEVFLGTAAASYWRNLYPGDFTDSEAGVGGVIAEMFPGAKFDWWNQKWTIPGIGDLGSGFLEREPGWYYFKKNAASPVIDRVEFDAHDPQRTDFGPNDAQYEMRKRMADDLIPIAVLHSAALLKLYVDEAEQLPPRDIPSDDPGDRIEPRSGGAGCAVGAGSAGGLSILVLLMLVLVQRQRCEPR